MENAAASSGNVTRDVFRKYHELQQVREQAFGGATVRMGRVPTCAAGQAVRTQRSVTKTRLETFCARSSMQ